MSVDSGIRSGKRDVVGGEVESILNRRTVLRIWTPPPCGAL